MITIQKCMELKLCCPRCGKHEFELKELPLADINDITYLLDVEKAQVTCKNCGLEDYVFNLVIAVTQRDYVKFKKEGEKNE